MPGKNIRLSYYLDSEPHAVHVRPSVDEPISSGSHKRKFEDMSTPKASVQFDLFPYPGPLPTKQSPHAEDKIGFRVCGYPPYKERRQSLRNPSNPRYQRFVDLRKTAVEAMAGRRWYDGAIQLDLTMYAPSFESPQNLNAYGGGLMDSLDGSHGPSFTYLPVVYQDDCQVVEFRWKFIPSSETYYSVEIKFI